MRLAHHLQQHPSGTFYFRLVVPAHLQASMGKKVIKQSLRTKDPALAKLLSYVLSAQHVPLLRTHRMKVSDLLANLGNIRTYEADLPGIGRVKADSPEDHQRLMETIRLLKEVGGLPASPPIPSFPTSAPAEMLGLEDASKRWEMLLAGAKPEAIKTKMQAVNEFVKWKGKADLASLNSTHFANFHLFLINDRKNSKPTIRNKFTYLMQFMEQMQAGNFYPKGDNPARGHVSYSKREKRARKKLGWQAYTPEQLAIIFKPSNYQKNKKPTEFWVPLIQLFTGARVNEVCQLECKDFGNFEGIPTLTITDEGENQSVKAEASIRTIPLHPTLIELGLLEFVEDMRKAGHRKIFPYLLFTTAHNYGARQTKAFTRYLKRHNIKPIQGLFGTHSFRKTLNQHIQDKVAIDVRSDFLGHEFASENGESYSKRYSPKALSELLLPHIRYKLDLLPLKYKQGQFDLMIKRELIYLKIELKKQQTNS